MDSEMITIELEQGSKEWHNHRAKYRNASESPFVMGASPYKTRDQFMREKHSGIKEEHNASTLALFDRGHEAERLARPLAEAYISDDLYPVVAVRGKMGASFDGITLLGHIVWECKLWNESKANYVNNLKVPERDYWQLVHQFYVSGAPVIVYTVTDGTEDNTVHLPVERDDVIESDIVKLLAGWEQFEKDLAEYEPAKEVEVVVGGSELELPVLSVKISGLVEHSNLNQFESQALSMIKGINRELVTDQHFADAKETVKRLKKAEDAIELKRSEILSDAASINAVFETLDRVQGECRDARLELNRYVTSEEKARKEAIQLNAEQDYNKHLNELQVKLGMNITGIAFDVASAMKGKRTIVTLEDAAKAEAARAKTDATLAFNALRASLDALQPFIDSHRFLFHDVNELVTQSPEQVVLIAKERISEYEKSVLAEKEAKALEEANSQKVAPSLEVKAEAAVSTNNPVARKLPSRVEIITLYSNTYSVSIECAEQELTKIFGV